jgi:rhamnogalacturonyl hydrolase YesR
MAHAQETTNKPGAPASGDASLTEAAMPAASPGITDAEIRDVLQRVARHQLRPLKDGDYTPVTASNALELAAAAPAPEGVAWTYPWGVTLYGMLHSTDVAADKEIEQFVLNHNLICGRYFVWQTNLQANLGKSEELATFVNKSKTVGLLRLGSLDNCGAMGAQMLEGILRHPNQESAQEKLVVARVADWIVNKQQRLPDGTLSRSQTGGTVWPDDLYMSCPFLVRWSKYTGDKKYLDDAASQIDHQAALEADTDGIWFHGYFYNEKKHAPFKWGRGNGWVMVATVEVLSALPEDHPARARLIEILHKQVEGIKPLQTPNGMWRQVLDKPELWEETSCTAMFAYGIARAVNRGWIDPANLAVARKAFAGVAKHVTPDGAVNGTCEGTGIGMELDFYIQRQRHNDDLHGRGPVMLAGAEILLAKQK